jgi:hypothetical protein
MGGGAFIWLKTGPKRPKSAKQAETGLASLRKIVTIGPSEQKLPASAEGHSEVVKPGFLPDMANSRGISRYCKLDHNVCWETGAVCCKAMRGKVEPSIWFSFYTIIYEKSAVDRCFGRDLLMKIPCQYLTPSMSRMNRVGIAAPRNEVCTSWRWFRIVPSSDKHGCIENLFVKYQPFTVAH